MQFPVKFKQLSLLLIGLLAIALRVWDLRQPFLGDNAWNEAYYANIARTFVLQGNLLHQTDNLYGGQPVMSSPLVPWLIYSGFKLFGIYEWAARLPILLCGLASLVCLYGLARSLYGERAGIVAAFLAATAPGIVFFSRNVQLDGPMVAAGLGALLTLRLYQMHKRFYWWSLALILFALALLAKYTAILIWPALTWLWFTETTDWRNKRHWLVWICFTGLALVPSVMWLAYAYSHLPVITGAAGANSYFLRFSQWSFGALKDALLSLWPRLLLQLGPFILIATVLLGVFGLAKAYPLKLSESHVFLALLVLPWYLPLGYPLAWNNNPYYEYAALYGFCLITAVAGVAVYDDLVQNNKLTPARQIFLVAALGVLITFANFWSYRDTYHRSYYPWPLIEQSQLFDSARQVAALNTAKAPVLTDVNMTLYYSEANLLNSTYIWWGAGDRDTIQAVNSCYYAFIVFEYPPTIGILSAIQQSGYQQIAPGAWQRGTAKTCGG